MGVNMLDSISDRLTVGEWSSSRSARFLTLIAFATDRLLAADDPTLMVEDLFGLIRGELQLDVFFNYRLTVDNRLELEASAGLTAEQEMAAAHLELGQAVCGTVARERRPYFCTDVQSSTDPMVGFVRDVGLHCYACTPLMHGDKVLGTLGFGRRDGDAYTDDELKFLRTICHYVALAKHRLTVERELRQGLRFQEELVAEMARRGKRFVDMADSLLGIEAFAAVGETGEALSRMRERFQVLSIGRAHNVGETNLSLIELREFLSHVSVDCARRHAMERHVPLVGERLFYAPAEKAVFVGLIANEVLESLARHHESRGAEDRMSLMQDGAASVFLDFEGRGIVRRYMRGKAHTSDRLMAMAFGQLNGQLDDSEIDRMRIAFPVLSAQ